MAHQSGLSPDEFWGLTPHEFVLVAQGHRQRLKQQQELAAWHVCYIINCWSKRKFRPRDLLGSTRISVGDFGSVDEFREAVKRMRDETGVVDA